MVKKNKVLELFKTRLVPTLALLLVFFLLASCAPVQQIPTESSPSPASSSTAPPKEKIVRVVQSWPCYIDPAVGQDNCAAIAHNNLYDSLITINEKNEIIPKVAKSWDFDSASNTYTFHLEKGIKFHNGDILTADDVLFSMKRLLDIGEGWAFLFEKVIGQYSAPDEETFIVALKESYGPFLSTLNHFFILNKDQVMANIKSDGPYGEMGDYGKDWLITHDAGSGPYMVKDMRTEEYLYGVRFPDYWGGWEKNAPDSFKLIGTTDPVTVRTLMNRKELEITDEWQPTENYQAMDKISGVDIANFFTGSILYLSFNTSKPPLDDVHFRRALVYAFDYQACHDKIFPEGKRTNGPIGSALPGWDSTLPFFERNLDKAKAELAQSKYANQLGQYPVEFAWVSEVPDEEKVALLMQSNAADIGIKIEVTKNPWLTMVDRAASAESCPHIFTEFKTSIPYPEAGAMLEEGYSSAGRGTFSNVHWFTDDIQSELDELLTDALGTMNNEDRYAKYKELSKKIIDLAPDVWAIEQPQRHAYQSEYLIWPDADSAKAGGAIHVMPGDRMYFKNMKFILEKMP